MRERREREMKRETNSRQLLLCCLHTHCCGTSSSSSLVVSVYQANKFAQIVAGNIHDSCGSSLGPGCFSCVSAAAVAAGRLPLPFAGPLNISEIGNFALDDGPQIGPHNEDTRPTRQQLQFLRVQRVSSVSSYQLQSCVSERFSEQNQTTVLDWGFWGFRRMGGGRGLSSCGFSLWPTFCVPAVCSRAQLRREGGRGAECGSPSECLV